MLFTTEDEYYWHYCTKDLIDSDIVETGQVLVKMRINEDMQVKKDCPKKLKNASNQQSFPTLIGSFILAHSRKIMNNFIHAINGFNQSKVFYTDTDSLFIKKWDLNILKEKGYFGKGLGQGKNDTNQPLYLNCKQILDANINSNLDACVKLNPNIRSIIA